MAHQDVEKDTTLREDDVRHGYTSSQDDYECEFTPAEQRKIIHRIDRRLVLTVGILYCISLMDRTNLSSAAIAGMNVELDLNQLMGSISHYSIVTVVFFTTYIVFQPPATVIARKLGPRNFLSAIVVLWGSVMVGMGFVKSYEALAACRVLLGVLEAGFFPSCVYLLSTWYTRFDVGKRYSVFYMLGSLASACAGILAYGIMQIGGKGLPVGTGTKVSAWRWIFIIEGALTMVLGIIAYWALVDFPDKAVNSWKFLNEREAMFIIDRVNRDRGDAKPEPFSARKFFGAATDLKIWGFALIFFNTTAVTYALAYFLPIILTQNLGFSIGASQCLVAPPYALAGIVMYATGWAGDKYHLRGPIVVFNMILCIIGVTIMGFHNNANVRYFGVFLTTAGANSNIPAAMSYQANNIRGQWKRAFCSATLVGAGGVGGIAGGLVFRTQDAPGYRPGLYACIACCILSIIVVSLITLGSWRSNKKADRGEVELEYYSDSDQKGFRYTY